MCLGSQLARRGSNHVLTPCARRAPLEPAGSTSDNEIQIENFAYLIDHKEVEQVRRVIESKKTFQGFSALAIAGMHTKGAWVLEKFGTKENLSEGCKTNLGGLSTALQLDVESEILEDTGFTPLMLAVMFGPPQSVEIIVKKVGDAVGKKTAAGYDAKRFAWCRQDAAIMEIFKKPKRGQCDREACQACSVM